MRMQYILILIACIGILGGCAHSPTPRQQAILDDPTIDQRYKDAMMQKKVIAGMTKDMVRTTWGNPASTSFVGETEIWTYTHGFAGGAFRAYYGLDSIYRHVCFEKGKVVGVVNTRTHNLPLFLLD
ncbi:MAG: hypothetical protein JRI46_09885 [Deltaproteobacteria bacterium]|nr:hypothetical protein [Deltaproteobacteria bacterium]